MSLQGDNQLRRIAEQVADRLAESGHAFVEDDTIDGLAAVLESFLARLGSDAGAATATQGGRDQ
ncbi:hypothetical protein [Krasilnikovia sp. MM14-A1259]|uniref:hypothetical protein n=1 Tax=Krasilnikovia sp. MM14-A1259 TaxID=3373539 RepID=UPI003813A3F0